MSVTLAVNLVLVELSAVLSLPPRLLTLELRRVVELLDDLLLVQLHLQLLVVHSFSLGALRVNEVALLVVTQADDLLEVLLTVDHALHFLRLGRGN